MFHSVDADQSASTAKTSFAVNSDGTSLRVGEVLLTAVHELVNDGLGWSRAVCEHHVFVVDVLCEEGGAIVFGLVQTDNFGDIEVLENVDVRGSCVSISVNRITLVYWSHESKEFAWNDPVQVTILNLFVVFVFASVECLEVVPSLVDSKLKSLEAVLHCAVIIAVTTAGISKSLQMRCVVFELLVSLFSVHFENDDHEGTHEVD